MLTEDLKVITYPEHQSSEKKMMLALKKIETHEDYIRMLARLYGFYTPLEDLIRRYPTLLPDLPERFRAHHLLADIRHSGHLIPTLEVCQDLPVIDSIEKALGALYVLEGSTLGGQIIAGIITHRLGRSASVTFFNSYGSETEKKWQSLKNNLNQPRTEEEQAIIIDAAKDTFITFKNWIGKHELQPQL